MVPIRENLLSSAKYDLKVPDIKRQTLRAWLLIFWQSAQNLYFRRDFRRI